MSSSRFSASNADDRIGRRLSGSLTLACGTDGSPFAGASLQLMSLGTSVKRHGAPCGAGSRCLVAGLGARGATRLIGMAAGEQAQGTAPTGEIVGRFTWLGTLGLLWFAVLVGIVAGLYYVWIRRFVPSGGLMKGLAFGGILLTTLAIELMLSDEFAFFEPPILGVSLFALLPLVFGLVAVPVADRFVAAIPPRDEHRRRTEMGKWTLVGASVLARSLLPSI
jgi:hypothetical protein